MIAFNSRRCSARPRRPHDWDDVLAPRWQDKILIRDPMASGTMRAIWGLILERSISETGDTARGHGVAPPARRPDQGLRAEPGDPDEKLARGEGLVTLWDLPDILIWQAKGMPFGYRFPGAAPW